MATDSQRLCRGCFQPIDLRSRKCPHCHAYQQKGVIWAAWLGVLLTAMFVLGILTDVLLTISDHRKQSLRREPPPNYADVVEVQESRLLPPTIHTEQRPQTVPAVIGVLRNNGTQPIASITLQIRCYDSQKKIVDTFQWSSALEIRPGSSVPFKASEPSYGNLRPAALPPEDYVSHEVVVVKAHPPSN